MKLFNSVAAFALITSVVSSVSAIVIPGADTPLFYLVATSGSSAANLLPLRLYGGTSGYSALSGSGPIGKFYFQSGQLVAVDPAGSTFTYRPNIGSILGPTGCSTYGQLGFVQGSSSNKCARSSTFQIQSDPENSQLGSRLVFNYIGGFYACGSDVWYKVAVGDGPTGCSAIDLYTVPVVA